MAMTSTSKKNSKARKEGLQIDPNVEAAESKSNEDKAVVNAKGVENKESAKKDQAKKKSVKKEKDSPAVVSKQDSKKKKGAQVYFVKVSPLDVALSIRHLSIMLRSGMPLTESIAVIVDQAADERIKAAYLDIQEKVSGGTSIAKAMEPHEKIFPHVIRSVIDVGEQGGTLEGNLIFLADFLKKSHELSRKIKGAMTYPMIIGGLTAVEMLGVIFFIMPQLDSLFSSFENIPVFTRFLMDASNFIQNNILLMLGIGFIVWLFQLFFFKTKVGIRTKETISLSFPIVKDMNQKHILTSFSRTLGILLESGIPIVRALEISGDTVGNGIYTEILQKVAEEVKGGTSVASALEKYPKYFPSIFTKMINIGEETGTLEENLLFLHEFYTEEVTEMSSNLATLMEPILLIFIGAMIGLLALTIISPIYQLTGSINSQ